jgi:hypothetical protein
MADLADLVIRPIGRDLTPDPSDTRTFLLTASAAMLRLWL